MIMNKDFVLIALGTAMLLSILGMLPLKALGFSTFCWGAIIMFCDATGKFLTDPPRENTCIPCGIVGVLLVGLAIAVLAA
jgi:hypothetical protein